MRIEELIAELPAAAGAIDHSDPGTGPGAGIDADRDTSGSDPDTGDGTRVDPVTVAQCAPSVIERLDEIPGIGQRAAQRIIAEIGLEMTRSPTPEHLVSWAKLCPRTIQSGPISRAAKTGKGRVGVRAIRFNLYRGGSTPVGEIDALARRVHDIVGWHAEFYVDAADLADLERALASLPQVSIDHLAMSDDTAGALLRLVESGMAVKATGFGRIHVRDPDRLMRTIVDIKPAALIFGSDLPSTRAATPFRDADLDRIASAVGAEHVAAVLAQNARILYRATSR